MVEAKENSALHTHYLLGTLCFPPPRVHDEITVLAPVLQKRTCSWSEVTIGDPATPNAVEVSTSMSVKGQKGDGGNILAL